MINENRVRPDMGFDTNGHRDVGILSDVLQGERARRGRIGNASPIGSADLQRVSAGSGMHTAAAPTCWCSTWRNERP
jgi:redox-sensitive bicupin YhaK (pirin superfamily)